VPLSGGVVTQRADPWPVRCGMPGPARLRSMLIVQPESANASTAPTIRAGTRARRRPVMPPVHARRSRSGRGGVPPRPGSGDPGRPAKVRKLTDPPHECGGSGTTGAIRSRTLQVGLGGWRLRGLHREAGGLPPDVVSSLHGLPLSERDSRKRRGFYERAAHRAVPRLNHAWKATKITRKSDSRRHSSESQDFQICHAMLHASSGARGPAPHREILTCHVRPR
jgi:hypothetical protein